jgi:hypothetical protein
LPSHGRVVTHLSHDRREQAATAVLAALKARTAGRPPVLTRDKVPASIEALIAHDSRPEPPPPRRGPGRPRQQPRRVLDPEWRYAQVDTHRDGGRVVAGWRRLIFGSTAVMTEMLGDQQLNTSYVERDNLTSRQRNGRFVRKPLSSSKKHSYRQRHLDLEDAVFNVVRPHQALSMTLPRPILGRTWHQRTPARAAGLTDHRGTLEERRSFRIPPVRE